MGDRFEDEPYFPMHAQRLISIIGGLVNDVKNVAGSKGFVPSGQRAQVMVRAAVAHRPDTPPLRAVRARSVVAVSVP
jgi:hypothetical protein